MDFDFLKKWDGEPGPVEGDQGEQNQSDVSEPQNWIGFVQVRLCFWVVIL